MSSFLGDEYPAAVTIDGVRMPLSREGRWTRNYANKKCKTWSQISRFMDGSASITFPELADEWPAWNDREQSEFCSACSWLHKQSDFPDMLRFMMQHGSPDVWSAIAGSVAKHLPQDEAFDLLVRALLTTEPGDRANISQGISLTKHPGADEVLRTHLASVWTHPDLWDDASFNNWIADEAMWCIKHLIEIGAPPEDFASQVRRLFQHSCARNRDACRRFLSEYFPWMNEQTNPSTNA